MRRTLCVVGAALSALLLTPNLAKAATLHNGWYYAIDSFNDGSGGSTYEMRGLAYKVMGNQFYFAISSGMPLGGNADSGALNGRISLGDVFFNFSNHNLDTLARFNDPNVFGVRFDAANDSSVAPGVYANLSAVNLTTSNHGYNLLSDYIAHGYGRAVDAMGDLENSNGDVTAYLSNGHMYPNIQAGTKIGNIAALNRPTLNGMGLDFAHFGADPLGNNVFGFSFNKNLMPHGNFTAHLFEECINDGVAIKGTNVPEPGSLAMLAAGTLSLGGMMLRRRRRR